MFRFTLRQLNNFVAIVEHGSISEAARATHASQAAMSQSLIELERAVGQQLAVRSHSRGVSLTGAGRRLLVDARRLIRQATELEDGMLDEQHDLSGALDLGCYTSVAPFWVPFIAAEFIARNPRLEVTIREGDGKELQQQMLEGRLDAVVTHTGHLLNGVQHERIRAGMGHVIVAADHRLANRTSVHLRELIDEDYVLLDLPSIRENQVPKFAALGLEPRIRWRSTSFEAVRGIVARGLGWSVLVQRPPAEFSYEGRGIATLEIDDEFEASDTCIAYPSGSVSRRLRALIDLCATEGARLDSLVETRPRRDGEA